MSKSRSAPSVAVIGGGPAGLMAAEVLAQGRARVDVYEAMPSVGRKFLMAGKGGMNITHAEPMDAFVARYGARRAEIRPLLEAFGPAELREWVHGLGIGTFVGTSGRVFPADMKAAPLLRAWLHRLREAGVRFHVRHRWCGWDENGALRFATPQGESAVAADTVVLALGGGSWAQLGSDGAWVPLFAQRGLSVAPLRPANCGFDVGWSEHFGGRFAGQPVKSVAVAFTDAAGNAHRSRGDLMATAAGIEGGPVYALSALLRDEIEAKGFAVVFLDLAPGRELPNIVAALVHPRGSRSLSSHLERRVNIRGVKMGLLRELLPAPDFDSPERLAAAIKSLPLRLIAPRPLDEAISSAGGVLFEALDETLMLRALPGVFCAGEMLDWEAPTGGYLLTACFASGRLAGLGALARLATARGAE
ncbi:MAG TPA: TIGR03862 family flavoprotein [Methylococcaceae bacterium]|nr:TIGR03862 family flavoprotein [Methylococcaceae bacterium]